VARPAVLLRQSEVEADRLCVTEVQVSIRLRRKARADGRRIGRRTCMHPAGPGRPAQRRSEYLPAARSASTTWRMKLLVEAGCGVCAGLGIRLWFGNAGPDSSRTRGFLRPRVAIRVAKRRRIVAGAGSDRR
jgi:hypothetical protein